LGRPELMSSMKKEEFIKPRASEKEIRRFMVLPQINAIKVAVNYTQSIFCAWFGLFLSQCFFVLSRRKSDRRLFSQCELHANVVSCRTTCADGNASGPRGFDMISPFPASRAGGGRRRGLSGRIPPAPGFGVFSINQGRPFSRGSGVSSNLRYKKIAFFRFPPLLWRTWTNQERPPPFSRGSGGRGQICVRGWERSTVIGVCGYKMLGFQGSNGTRIPMTM